MSIIDQTIAIAERWYEAILRVPARRKLAQLEPSSAECTAIKAALLGTLNGVRTAEEQAWINRIEARRIGLNSSKEEVTVTDYGAVKRYVRLSAEEMYRGTLVRKTIGSVSRQLSKSPFWSFVLFRLIRELKPRTCLELGTALGISGSYQAASLKLNCVGTLVTLEGAAPFAAIAEAGFQFLKLNNTLVVPGRFQDTLSQVLRQHAPIDYAFIDGHHDGAATQEYFEQIAGAAAETAIFVLDDISWSRGMKQAWRYIISDERTRISFDLGGIGICILSRHISTQQHIRVRMG